MRTSINVHTFGKGKFNVTKRMQEIDGKEYIYYILAIEEDKRETDFHVVLEGKDFEALGEALKNIDDKTKGEK